MILTVFAAIPASESCILNGRTIRGEKLHPESSRRHFLCGECHAYHRLVFRVLVFKDKTDPAQRESGCPFLLPMMRLSLRWILKVGLMPPITRCSAQSELRRMTGVHSLERSAQEDTLLVLFNTAISNLVSEYLGP